jgi:hypothetical protein
MVHAVLDQPQPSIGKAVYGSCFSILELLHLIIDSDSHSSTSIILQLQSQQVYERRHNKVLEINIIIIFFFFFAICDIQ